MPSQEEIFFTGPVETPQDQLLSDLGEVARQGEGDMVSALRFARRVYAMGSVAQVRSAWCMGPSAPHAGDPSHLGMVGRWSMMHLIESML